MMGVPNPRKGGRQTIAIGKGPENGKEDKGIVKDKDKDQYRYESRVRA